MQIPSGERFRVNWLTNTRLIGRSCAKAFLILTFIVLVGCGPKSNLLPVEGSVSLNGAPLKSGTIRFTSTSDGKSYSAEPTINDGKYAIPRAKGLPPGTYHIMISAIDENSPMVTIRDAAGNPVTTAPADLIPAEYNSESSKTVDVVVDGENQFNFDIVSKK